MNNMSLISIMRDDPDFGRRLQKKVQEVKADKENILSAADEYGKRYQKEIIEGTELRNRYLTEGSNRGLTEEQVIANHGFIPTVYTPILNFLYFLLRESENDNYYGRQHDEKRRQLNERFGHLHEEEVKSAVLKEPPEMVNYLYGNITLDTFNTIKKLKALSKSSNEKEAFQAYRKANELCKKYNLEFDRIPCYVKGENE